MTAKEMINRSIRNKQRYYIGENKKSEVGEDDLYVNKWSDVMANSNTIANSNVTFATSNNSTGYYYYTNS